jgi:hypothetical protein
MQQRQLRLGDILDDYCPRERRLTNHAVVAMVGPEVKQTRCTTCDAEHEYKHARVPRQRRKAETPAALLGQAPAGPKRVSQERGDEGREDAASVVLPAGAQSDGPDAERGPDATSAPEPFRLDQDGEDELGVPALDHDGGEPEDGPVHRPLIRATLPRTEGQPPPARPAPDFTIRQPGGRPNRFRPRHQRGSHLFHGGDPSRGSRPNNARSPMARPAKRHGPGRNKRSK